MPYGSSSQGDCECELARVTVGHGDDASSTAGGGGGGGIDGIGGDVSRSGELSSSQLYGFS